MRLVRIEIKNIDDLKCPWNKKTCEALPRYVEFCRKTKIEDIDLAKAAVEVYGTDTEKNRRRVGWYTKYIKSFFDYGYNGILVHEDALDTDEHPIVSPCGAVNIGGALPRIHHNNRNPKNCFLDDGNHRVPILRALGVKTFPVAIINHSKGKPREIIKDMEDGLRKFFLSPEWKQYKKTKDYEILCSRPNDEGNKHEREQ